jgi:hypothetical protein
MQQMSSDKNLLLFGGMNESKGNCFENFNLNDFSPQINNKHSAYTMNLEHEEMIGQEKNQMLDVNYNKEILSPIDLKFQNTYDNYNTCPIILKLDRSVLPTRSKISFIFICIIFS